MLIGALAQYFFGFTIFVLSTFLVLLVLVQRGRGGGLTGALGGPGGQSAFGTKAGDLFTRITIGVATAWILLCASAVFMLRGRALPETGGVDRPSAKSELGVGAGSGTTGAGENASVLPKIDSPSVDLPNSDASKADSLEVKPVDPVAPGEGATQAAPNQAPPSVPETTSTPGTSPAAAVEPAATAPTPPAANATPDPTAPK